MQTEGIIIETENGPERIYFALGLVLGDKLGLNSIFGFVESFNSNYFCRLCKMSKKETQFLFIEGKVCSENYAEDVSLNDTSLTGIKEKSVWDV